MDNVRLILILILNLRVSLSVTWTEWWTYEGISGPDYWGRIHEPYSICKMGKNQSPINIDLENLIFDPHLLQPLKFIGDKFPAILMNQGNVFKLKPHSKVHHHGNHHHHVFLSGGPINYKYKLNEIIFHFGSNDSIGSEHTINNYSFPAEIQLLFYNSELNKNLTNALNSNYGVAIVSLLVKINKFGNSEIEKITNLINNVTYKDNWVIMKEFSLSSLVQNSKEYITYQGSLSRPACEETVTWVILNKPLFMNKYQISKLRSLLSSSPSEPPKPLENNFRKPNPLNSRPIRTNINFHKKNDFCTMKTNHFYYKMNKK